MEQILKNIKFIMLFAVANTPVLFAQSNNSLDSISLKIDTYLYDVETTRLFIDGKEYGLRILHYKGGWEHVGSEFYFQWIEYDENGGKIVEQEELKEAGRLWSMNLDQVERKDDGVYIAISASHSYDGTERLFNIKINSIGDYYTLDSDFDVKAE